MGLLLSWISFPFPLSVPVPVPVPISIPLPLTRTNPLEIDVPLAFTFMVQIHWRVPTLCWRHTYWRTRTGFTNRGKGGRRGRERRGMASSCTVTIAVSVAMVRLAFQTIAVTLVLKKGTWTRTQLKGHRWVRVSFPISISIPRPISFTSSFPIPISVSLAFTVPDDCAGGEGRPR